jgi:inward rectifier potassium channel
MPILQRISWYHTMIDMGMWRFMLIIISLYAGINFIFATIYYGIGIEHLDGIASTDSEWVKFGQAYF